MLGFKSGEVFQADVIDVVLSQIGYNILSMSGVFFFNFHWRFLYFIREDILPQKGWLLLNVVGIFQTMKHILQ